MRTRYVINCKAQSQNEGRCACKCRTYEKFAKSIQMVRELGRQHNTRGCKHGRLSGTVEGKLFPAAAGQEKHIPISNITLKYSRKSQERGRESFGTAR